MGNDPKLGGHQIQFLKPISWLNRPILKIRGDQIHPILPKHQFLLNLWTMLPPLHLQATRLPHFSLFPLSSSHLQSPSWLTPVSLVSLIRLKYWFSKLCDLKPASWSAFYSTTFVLIEILNFYELKPKRFDRFLNGFSQSCRKLGKKRKMNIKYKKLVWHLLNIYNNSISNE
jgi:hypothetical protein